MTRLRTVLLVVCACLLAPFGAPPAGAQAPALAPARSFAELAELGHGQPSVKLVDIQGRKWSGRLLGVSAEAVLVGTGTGVRTFQPDEVWEIWTERGGSFWKGMGYGALVGGVLSLAAKAGEGDCADPRSLCAQDGPVRWSDAAAVTMFCGLVGGGIAVFTHQRHMLYVAPPTRAFGANRSPRTPVAGLVAAWQLGF